MALSSISTPAAPKAIGPYSQAVACGPFVYTAGQVALDPATMELVPGGVAEQTDRALTNLAAVLKAAGTGFDRVVKTTVYLVDMADFAAMNSLHRGRGGTAQGRPGRDRRGRLQGLRGRIGPGGLAGLQNRDGAATGGLGGFDSHTLPPPFPPRGRDCQPSSS